MPSNCTTRTRIRTQWLSLTRGAKKDINVSIDAGEFERLVRRMGHIKCGVDEKNGNSKNLPHTRCEETALRKGESWFLNWYCVFVRKASAERREWVCGCDCQRCDDKHNKIYCIFCSVRGRARAGGWAPTRSQTLAHMIHMDTPIARMSISVKNYYPLVIYHVWSWRRWRQSCDAAPVNVVQKFICKLIFGTFIGETIAGSCEMAIAEPKVNSRRGANHFWHDGL